MSDQVVPQALTETAQQKLLQMISRIEKLEEEKSHIADDIKESYSEAKTLGFDTKIMRKVISLRKIERSKREEQEQILDLYMLALGEV